MAMRDAASPPSLLILDSGIGGMSVARAIRARRPDATLTYVADSAGFPYGARTAEDITGRVAGLVETALARWPVDAVVIACNTASTVVLDTLRRRFAVPFVGVVPPVKTAAAVSRSRVIALLATERTIQGPYLDRLIAEHAAGCRVLRLGCPGLAEMAEARARGGAVDRARLEAVLAPLREPQAEGLDTVVLGCTHYPFLRPDLEAVLGPGLTWLDPAEPVARRLDSVLADLPPAGPRALPPSTAWFTGPPGPCVEAEGLAPLLRDLGLTAARRW